MGPVERTQWQKKGLGDDFSLNGTQFVREREGKQHRKKGWETAEREGNNNIKKTFVKFMNFVVLNHQDYGQKIEPHMYEMYD
jgi:hypothetical protein